MKKIFMILIFVLISSTSYGATGATEESEIYVRQDVFDAKMEALFNRLHSEIVDMKMEIKTDFNELRNDISGLSNRIDSVNEKVDSVNTSLNGKIETLNGSLNEKIETLNSSLNGKIETLNGSLNEKIETLNSSLNGKMETLNSSLNGKMDSGNSAINGRIDSLSGRIDGLDYKIDVLQTVVYWGLGILSLLVASFVFAPVLGNIVQNFRKPSFTLEDIERLIDSKLSTRL